MTIGIIMRIYAVHESMLIVEFVLERDVWASPNTSDLRTALIYYLLPFCRFPSPESKKTSKSPIGNVTI